MLTLRQNNIISYLSSKNDFVTIKELSSIFQLSERSIQYDIENIEYFKSSLNIEIIRSKNSGVKLKAHNQLENSNFKKEPSEISYSPQERMEKILIMLFESLLPITSRYFAEHLHVTRRTIYTDIKEVEQWVENRNLTLDYINNKGFYIKGDEKIFRESYVEILVKHYQSNVFFSNINILNADELALIHQSIESVLRNEQYNIIQTAKNGLIFHLAISIHRIHNNFKISMPQQELNKLQQQEEYDIAKKIQKNVESNFNLIFPDSEIGYITLHLLGAKLSESHLNENKQKNQFIIEPINEFIKRVSGYTGINLTDDQTLFNGLVIHLKPAIYRMQYELRNENPLKKEIHKHYPNILIAIQSNLFILEDEFSVKFNEDEIAFITLHVGSAMERKLENTRQNLNALILCASGVGTSQLLSSKLENYYPEINIIESSAIYEIEESYFNKNNINLVISTIPTPKFPVPVINVSPFLTKEDRNKLNKYLNKTRERNIENTLSNGPSLNILLPQKNISWNVSITDWKEAIKYSTDLLMKQGIINQEYFKAIIQQFKINGPYMVIAEGIALLHAKPSDGVIHPGISFIKLQHPVKFGQKEFDPITFVICLATTNAHIHLNALKQLSLILQDSSYMKDLTEGNKDTLVQMIEKVSEK